MKNLKRYAVAALAGVGAVQVVGWLNTGLIHMLVVHGEWAVQDAVKASPWILFASLSGTAMSLYEMWAENRQYTRSATRRDT